MSSEKNARDSLLHPYIASLSFEDAVSLIAEVAKQHKIPFFGIFGNVEGQAMSLSDPRTRTESCRTVGISGGFEPEALQAFAEVLGHPIGKAREVADLRDASKMANEILASNARSKSKLN
jgi:hypothetical protein